MKQIKLKKSDIVPNDWNFNFMQEEMFNRLKMSLELCGQVLPIIVVKHKDKYVIIDGEHRWKALDEKSSIDCIELEKQDIVPVIKKYNIEETDVYKGLTAVVNLVRGRKVPESYFKALKQLSEYIPKERAESVFAVKPEVLDVLVQLADTKEVREYKKNENKEAGQKRVSRKEGKHYRILVFILTPEEVEEVRHVINQAKKHYNIKEKEKALVEMIKEVLK